MKKLFFIPLTILITSCSSNPPKETHNNICHIYEYDDDWEDAAKESASDWGTPEYVLMAFIHQESRFTNDAQPEREYALGFIPLPRRSSAFGYPQAQDPAWLDYQRASKNRSARRTDIEDSLDFVGWYNYQSHIRNKISRHDAYNLYLAYHEGHGGYNRKTYLKKKWLIKVAKKVERRAAIYKNQLKNCGKFKSYKQLKKKKNQNKDQKQCNAPWPYC
jgi:hypothetical protein